MWLKLAKIGQQLTDFQTFFGYFHVFQVEEHDRDRFRMITFKNETFEKNSNQKFHFWSILPIFGTIYEVKITF
jgi:hypothetical protein